MNSVARSIDTFNTKRNLDSIQLVEEAIARGEGRFSRSGALLVSTGAITGRSPKHKFIVREESSADHIWWDNNKPISADAFERIRARMFSYLGQRQTYLQDLRVGADDVHSLRIRVVNEYAWHSLFARTMFIRLNPSERVGFSPDFTVVNAPGFFAEPETDETSGGTFILINFKARLVLIGGTAYAGETKKAVFSIMNYVLPMQGILSMHCSANVGAGGDAALFFGLSGTGKTTLSADPARGLVGDDEHYWTDRGVANIEGGCYAKCIDLSRESEPLIYDAIRFGAVVENAVMDDATREIDFSDGSLTENTRAAYPLEYIPNAVVPSVAPTPQNVVFLTCDANGVLPPISRLDPAQAMYHYLLGYTAKVAGTESGITEPQLTFSPCFGAPFLPLHPSRYARLLGERLDRTKARCWLVNTGWSGGGFGVGRRMSIAHTRALVNAALAGKLDAVEYREHPVFRVAMPAVAPGVPADVLDPRRTWGNAQDYDQRAVQLAREFHKSFERYSDYAGADVRAAGPRVT
jgi:phosphoenolpyruvate carboxykinase (ATP)